MSKKELRLVRLSKGSGRCAGGAIPNAGAWDPAGDH